MIVMKFGGSSVANAGRIRQVAEIVKARLDRRPVLVLSAMGDTTDHLLEAGEAALKKGVVQAEKIEELHLNTVTELTLGTSTLEAVRLLLTELRNLLMGISLIRELTGKTRDYLVSFGERLSVRIAAAHFTALGIKARAMDAWDAGIVSDSGFTSAELSPESWNLIPARLLAPAEEGLLQVVTGFIAKDEKGNITTLGRGGSDLSATIIAASCGAEEVQVWKDVDGILTADPRIVKNAKPVETITYEAAAELAYYGAQVLHPRAMQPCIKTGTPVLVKNSYNPDAPGTRIVPSQSVKTNPIQAISTRKNITLVDIVSSRMLGQHGFLAEVFSCFAKYGVSVDMVATSEVSVSLTLDAVHDLTVLVNDLSKIASVEIKTGKAIVTIIGDVYRSSEILSRTFRICELLGVQVQMISQGASKVNISFIVDDKEAAEVVKGLHGDFFDTVLSPTGGKK
ncbi:MAG: aspartate kinase [Treponema sp.]|jgi:aspartate kinase|nr:aspartate kinase [Treponema sp.]